MDSYTSGVLYGFQSSSFVAICTDICGCKNFKTTPLLLCVIWGSKICVFVGAQQYDDIPPPSWSCVSSTAICASASLLLLPSSFRLPFCTSILLLLALRRVLVYCLYCVTAFVCSWLSLSTTTTTTNMCIHLYLALLCAGGCWPPSGGSTGGIYVGIHRQLLPLLWWHFLYIVTLDSENKTNNVEAKPTTATTHSEKQEEES